MNERIKQLKNIISQIKLENQELENKKLLNFKRISDITNELKSICNHNWVKDNYLYADTYCSICGVLT